MDMRRLKTIALCFGLTAATLASQDVSPVMAETTKQHLTRGQKSDVNGVSKKQRHFLIRTGMAGKYEWTTIADGGIAGTFIVDPLAVHVTFQQ